MIVSVKFIPLGSKQHDMAAKELICPTRKFIRRITKVYKSSIYFAVTIGIGVQK